MIRIMHGYKFLSHPGQYCIAIKQQVFLYYIQVKLLQKFEFIRYRQPFFYNIHFCSHIKFINHFDSLIHCMFILVKYVSTFLYSTLFIFIFCFQFPNITFEYSLLLARYNFLYPLIYLTNTFLQFCILFFFQINTQVSSDNSFQSVSK